MWCMSSCDMRFISWSARWSGVSGGEDDCAKALDTQASESAVKQRLRVGLRTNGRSTTFISTSLSAGQEQSHRACHEEGVCCGKSLAKPRQLGMRPGLATRGTSPLVIL